MRFAGKIFIIIVLLAGYALGQCKTENCGLVVRGKVTDLTVDRSDKHYVRFYAKIDAEFKNEGSEPIILFKPEFDDGYWLGGRSLSVTENGETVFVVGHWQSVSGDESYRKLAEGLDFKTPPKELTITLKPGETWNLQSETQIGFSAEEERNTWPKRRSWKEMQEFPSKLWLTIDYEISPWNIEYFKPNLIRKLAKRWKSYGNVLIEQKKEGRFNQFTLSSEPMVIDFGQARTEREESRELE